MSNTLINQAMKRLLTLGLMLASAFALTNCAEQLDTPDQEKDIIVDVTDHEYGAGDPYEIYVDDVDTKPITLLPEKPYGLMVIRFSYTASLPDLLMVILAMANMNIAL